MRCTTTASAVCTWKNPLRMVPSTKMPTISSDHQRHGLPSIGILPSYDAGLSGERFVYRNSLPGIAGIITVRGHSRNEGVRAGQASFQLCFHFRPLVIQNAEIDAVADSSGPGDYMAAKRALFFRADAENRVARFLVQRIGFQFDPNASPDFKGVAQHQIFRFGVHCACAATRERSRWSRFQRGGWRDRCS